MKINILWFAHVEQAVDWPFGESYCVPYALQEVCACLEKHLADSDAQAWLFWDSKLGSPPLALIQKLLNTGDELWHAGLKLGTCGQPDFIDFVSPTWMLNRDPDSKIEATSWRLSLRACLIRTEVLRQIGGPLKDFSSLEAAGLELGFRCIRNGVFMRHVPGLVDGDIQTQAIDIPIEDQLRFIKAGFGKKWMYWAGIRALITGRTNLVECLYGLKSANRFNPAKGESPFKHTPSKSNKLEHAERVSVLIPTVNRYSYLRILLSQLRYQTVKPYEILVIDQTAEAERDHQILQEFSDLPLRWFIMDRAGQCSSRNLGLQNAQGNYILFIDDDDEIPDDLIEDHLESLEKYSCKVSNGIANEVGISQLPDNSLYLRISDAFPTGNTLIKREVLYQSRLFDLAYDGGMVEDADLGMRVYLAGQKMVLNPDISVLHHHAPQGGLRIHKARVFTYADSRKRITRRVLPSISVIYLSRRYFTARQVREMLWISVLGTFSLHGPPWRKLLKALISAVVLPDTLLRIRVNDGKAKRLMATPARIPELDDQMPLSEIG
jgi:glycosyltransferase involved in cell wall biosynthesis